MCNHSSASRDHLLEDAFRQLELKSADLKKPLRISYVGCGEQGLDMGGLQKEFFQVVTAALFSPENEKGERRRWCFENILWNRHVRLSLAL